MEAPKRKKFGPTRKRPSFTKTYPRPSDLIKPSSKGIPKAISLHQPYASLLAHGVMRGEGRFWKTDVRGKLWICSTGRQVKPSEIKRLERKFAENYTKLGYDVPEFPKKYPIRSIVGRVTIDDVITQEEATKKIKDGVLEPYYAACGGAHVFICRDFETLSGTWAVRGRPRIYNLPRRLVYQCRRDLKRVQPLKRKFVPVEFPELHVVTMDNLLTSSKDCGMSDEGEEMISPKWQQSVVREIDYDYEIEPLPLGPPQQTSWGYPAVSLAEMYPCQYPQPVIMVGQYSPNGGITEFPISPVSAEPTVVPESKNSSEGFEKLRMSLQAYWRRNSSSSTTTTGSDDGDGRSSG